MTATAEALAPAMSENQLERKVRGILNDLASLAAPGTILGYHTHDSRKSAGGFPDWCFTGPGGVLFRELKTERGKLSQAQEMWLQALARAGADVDVWRPADLLSGRIARELAALRALDGAQ